LWVNQLSRGPTRRLPRFISLSYGSLGRGNGRDLSGWPVQLRAVRGGPLGVSCRVASPAAGLRDGGPSRPGMQLALFKPLQVVRSSDGLDFPWVAGPAAGLRGGPPRNSSSQGRQSNRRPTRFASGPPLSSYGSFGRAMASTPPGGWCSCRTQ
jgi:hypothetical protein